MSKEKAAVAAETAVATSADGVTIKSGILEGQTIAFGKMQVKKVLDEQSEAVSFAFNDGESVDVSPEVFPEAVQKYLRQMGLSAVLGDAYASAKTPEDKMFALQNKIDSLVAGKLSIRKPAIGGDLDTLRAVAQFRGLDSENKELLEKLRIALRASAEKQKIDLSDFLSALSRDPDIRALKANIVAERARLKAESAKGTALSTEQEQVKSTLAGLDF